MLLAPLVLALLAQGPAPAPVQDATAVPAPPPELGAALVPGTLPDAEVAASLAAAFEGSEVPGGVAAIAEFGKPLRVGAFGVRRIGHDEPYRTDDPVHIGSCTKAMTAVLAARLVDAEELAWDTTLGAGLPEVAEAAHEGFRDVTLLDLLRHTAGVPANAASWWRYGREPLRERRLRIAKANLVDAPEFARGDGFLYSNLGVMLAGALCASAQGEGTWEEHLRREVAEPLGLERLGFGWPGTKGDTGAPWGHTQREGQLVAVQRDNAEALGPAGTVHLPLEDWARFALLFTDAGAEASGDYLSAAARAQLVEPGRNDYACGWLVGERDWAGGTTLTHNGSNTYAYAVVWVAPRRDRAFLLAVNAMLGDTAERADGAIYALTQLADE